MNKKVIKDLVFGAAGGAAGTFVIGTVMDFVSRMQSRQDRWIERELVREEPTQGVARRVAQTGFGVDLTKRQKQQLGQVVHWSYGIAWGAVYGLLRNRVPMTSRAGGLPFGMGLGVVGPGILLPMLKLTPPATEFPVSAHVRGLVSHYAYGATVEAVCTGLEAVDRALSRRSRQKLTKDELREVA